MEREPPDRGDAELVRFTFAASTAFERTSRRRFDGFCFRPVDVWIT
jgi:hypothetical protein